MLLPRAGCTSTRLLLGWYIVCYAVEGWPMDTVFFQPSGQAPHTTFATVVLQAVLSHTLLACFGLGTSQHGAGCWDLEMVNCVRRRVVHSGDHAVFGSAIVACNLSLCCSCSSLWCYGGHFFPVDAGGVLCIMQRCMLA